MKGQKGRRIMIKEKWKDYLTEDFAGDENALWDSTLSACRHTLTFTDLVNETDSSFDKALREELNGNEQALRETVLHDTPAKLK